MTADNHELTHAEFHVIGGDIYIPPGFVGDPHIIVPDEIVALCAIRNGLAANNVRGIDPMCGAGTIPRVIAALGGVCDAGEKDPKHYAVATQILPVSTHVVLEDFLTQPPPKKTYDYIYTSAPFIWFEDYPKHVPDELGAAMLRYLGPGGMLLLDSDDQTKRDERTWPLAIMQVDYFVAAGFEFVESLRFVADSTLDGAGDKNRDISFTELKFKAP